MDLQEAMRILGLDQVPDSIALKRHYRKLMLVFHPDSQGSDQDVKETHQAASAINAAYDWISAALETGNLKPGDKPDGRMGHKSYRGREDCTRTESEGRRADRSNTGFSEDERVPIWNAPRNPQAFCSREIYAEVEDSDGQVVAVIPIAKGKFYWTKDEEFSFFMKSIRRAAENLLDRVDQKLERERNIGRYRTIQPKLSFLLAQQMIDAQSTMPWVCRDVTEQYEHRNEKDMSHYVDSDSEAKQQRTTGSDSVILDVRTYEARAELELQRQDIPLHTGERLLPSRFCDYRLYVKNRSGEELGYLSFPDDRLYYVLIPLFRQRTVQLQIIVEEDKVTSVTGRKRRNASVKEQRKDSRKLKLLIRKSDTQDNGLPENLNDEIIALLRQYGTA